MTLHQTEKEPDQRHDLSQQPLSIRAVALRYCAFAGLAVLANLAAQRLVLSFGDGSALFATALVVGTGVGLVVKYILDKRWIFYDQSPDHMRQFSLYACVGLITTALFWGTEISFWLIWRTETAREIGAVLGLSAGYVLKYQLDRRFVFTPDHAKAP